MTLKFKLLGRSGLRVSEVALGTMTFGGAGGFGASKDESRKMFEAYAAAGGNFIDSANSYTGGESEELVGEFIAGARENFVVATKYSVSMNKTHPNGGGNHRKSLVQSLEQSLKRLNTDYIDVYWVHVWDFMTPVEEVMRALDDQVRAGKILYVGISDAPAWIVSQANTLAALQGWSPFIGLQTEYSLVQRDAERDLIPMAEAFDIGVTAWSPLGAGVLTGKYQHKEPENARKARINAYRSNERNVRVIHEAVHIASEIGKTPAQVALNWIRQKRGVFIPILGAKTVEQLQDNLASVEFDLTEQQLERLDEVSRIGLGFPHDFIGSDGVKGLINGEFRSRIDNHRR
ncbi:aldo/keto reductase [Paenibacillus sacheonensis]|uniref:aldo/keto reductase n=1 Tax=Paenibacillus sacheonensis TaxID=742054 RepID=UPI001EF8F949|nr:aldo/keto reductase [Paenibacillus sacheonensis]